jgi:hypothetical protein
VNAISSAIIYSVLTFWSNKTGFMMLTYLRSPQLRYMT